MTPCRFPDLLFLEAERPLPADSAILSDLQADALISSFFGGGSADELEDYLLRPCSAATIAAREELFESSETADALSKWMSGLYELSRRFDIYKAAESVEEKAVAFSMCAKSYQLAALEGAALPRKTRLVSRLAEAFEAETKSKAFLDSLEAAKACEEEYAKVPRFGVFATRYDKLGMAETRKSLNAAVLRAAAGIGIEPTDKISVVKPGVFTFPLLCEFSGEYYGAIKRLCSACSGLVSDEPLKYLPDISFLLNARVFLDNLRERGVRFCRAQQRAERGISIRGGSDISLCAEVRIMADPPEPVRKKRIVKNDAEFSPNSRMYLLFGPNSGGKTTYLRMVGLCTLFYLAGLPVPADSAVFGPISGITTFFPTDENFAAGEGRLQNEKNRLEKVLAGLKPDGLLLINEIYSTTYEGMALDLLEGTVKSILARSVFSLLVTHHRGIAARTDKCEGLGFLEAADGYKIRNMALLPKSEAELVLSRLKLDRASLAERGGKS